MNIPFNCRPSWSQGLLSSTHIICLLTITWLLRSFAIFLSSEWIGPPSEDSKSPAKIHKIAMEITNFILISKITRFTSEFYPFSTRFPLEGRNTTELFWFLFTFYLFCADFHWKGCLQRTCFTVVEKHKNICVVLECFGLVCCFYFSEY